MIRDLVRRHRGCRLAAALTLTFAAQAPAAAQRDTRPAERPGWLPRDERPINGLTAAQRAGAIATLDRIERLLRQVPELANPDGFEILPVILGGAVQDSPGAMPMAGSVAEYILRLQFFVPSKAESGEGCGCIEVRVNQTQSARMYDAQGRHIYIEAPRAMQPRGTPEQIAGTLWQVPQATQVYGELWEPSRDIREGRPERSIVDVLFVGAGELPWKPVTREAFYDATLLEIEGTGGERLAEFRASLEKTRYEQWMEGAEERRRNREQTLSELAKHQSAAEVEKMRELLETTEREVTEQMRRNEAGDRERNAEALAASFGHRDSLRAELERMSPAERSMPTYIGGPPGAGPRATGWELTNDSTPPAWRVLTPNYDFWRARRSPVDVRSINVHIGIAGTGLDPNVRNALLQTFRKLDWAAFNQLLDAPR
jgi:hypothetical protein